MTPEQDRSGASSRPAAAHAGSADHRGGISRRFRAHDRDGAAHGALRFARRVRARARSRRRRRPCVEANSPIRNPPARGARAGRRAKRTRPRRRTSRPTSRRAARTASRRTASARRPACADSRARTALLGLASSSARARRGCDPADRRSTVGPRPRAPTAARPRDSPRRFPRTRSTSTASSARASRRSRRCR